MFNHAASFSRTDGKGAPGTPALYFRFYITISYAKRVWKVGGRAISKRNRGKESRVTLQWISPTIIKNRSPSPSKHHRHVMIIIIELLCLQILGGEKRGKTWLLQPTIVSLSPRAKFLPWKSFRVHATRRTRNIQRDTLSPATLRFHTPTTGSFTVWFSMLSLGKLVTAVRDLPVFLQNSPTSEFIPNRRWVSNFTRKTKKSSG